MLILCCQSTSLTSPDCFYSGYFKNKIVAFAVADLGGLGVSVKPPKIIRTAYVIELVKILINVKWHFKLRKMKHFNKLTWPQNARNPFSKNFKNLPHDPPTRDHLWRFLPQNPFSEIHPSFCLMYFFLPLHSLNKYFLLHLFQKKHLMLLVPRFLLSQTPRQLLERKQVLYCIIHLYPAFALKLH